MVEAKSRYDISHLIGQKFNRWTILKDLGKKGKANRRTILVVCECGFEGEREFTSVRSGNSKSCGCHNLQALKDRAIHGLKGHPLYIVWKQMRQRCLNPKSTFYKHYGGKGVVICQEWLDSFKSFYDWGIANGYRRGLELDKDKNAPGQTGMQYSPEFCSFVEPSVNKRNMSTNRMIEYNGEVKCLAEWAEQYKICRKRLSRRLDKGMSMKDAIANSRYAYMGMSNESSRYFY